MNCVEVPAWHELRASFPNPLSSICRITINGQDFEKIMNRSYDILTVCLDIACPKHLFRLTAEPLWFGVVPESSVYMLVVLVSVMAWYGVFGCKWHRIALLY